MSTQTPPPNWLAPLSGGLVLFFFGVILAVISESLGVGILLCLVGAALAAWALAKRDRYMRYGR